eukprot:8312816-Pyramimonas_sp.AAC.1
MDSVLLGSCLPLVPFLSGCVRAVAAASVDSPRRAAGRPRASGLPDSARADCVGESRSVADAPAMRRKR